MQVIAVVVAIVSAFLFALAWRRECGRRREASCRADILREDLRNVLANLSSGLVITDHRGVVQRMNPAAGRILLVDEGSIVHKTITDIFEPGLHDFTRALAQVLAGGEPVQRRELHVVRSDGEELPVGISVSPVRAVDGALTGAVAIFQDLTEIFTMREQMREADQLAAVGELSAGIAHEIRNPLGSIRGSVEILATELDVGPEERKLMDLILRESRRVNDIITDFLSFARTRAARPKLVEVRPFLDDVALQMRIHVEERRGDVEVIHTIGPEDMLAVVDAEQMKQVMLNLAMNACEAMDYAGRLTIEAALDEQNTACLLTVSDSGPGVAEQDRDLLFKPFFTQRKGGTGLGLSVVKRIVHAHGGQVELKTSADGGAAFVVVLPFKQPVPDGVEPEAAALLES